MRRKIRSYTPEKPKKGGTKKKNSSTSSSGLAGILGGVEEAKGNARNTAKHGAVKVLSFAGGTTLGVVTGKHGFIPGILLTALGLFKGSDAASSGGLGMMAGSLLRPENKDEHKEETGLIKQEKARATSTFKVLTKRAGEAVYIPEIAQMISGTDKAKKKTKAQGQGEKPQPQVETKTESNTSASEESSLMTSKEEAVGMLDDYGSYITSEETDTQLAGYI